jgi:hypothetical protein
MSHWVIDLPHCDPVSAGTSCTRLLHVSAMYRSDVPGANAIPVDWHSSADRADPPSPLSPIVPDPDPAIV